MTTGSRSQNPISEIRKRDEARPRVRDARSVRKRSAGAGVGVACLGAAALVFSASVAGAQPRPGFPTVTPVPEGHQAIPIEIAITMSNGTVACRPPEARLPTDELLRLQIVNLTDHVAAIVAPALFGSGERIASVVRADYTPGGAAVIVQPGTIGQVVFETMQPGHFPFACDVAVPGATAGQGVFVVVDEELRMQRPQGMQPPGATSPGWQQPQGMQPQGMQPQGMQMPFLPAPGG